MIRLGSLAGYPFEGPRVLAGWTPPTIAAVYAVMYRPDSDAKPQDFAVIYVGHSDDLTLEPFPFKHPQAGCWTKRAGDRWNLHICTYEVPGGLRSHREQISRELIAVYKPGWQPGAVRPGVEGRMDRQLQRADGWTSHHRARPFEGQLSAAQSVGAVCVATISAAIANATS